MRGTFARPTGRTYARAIIFGLPALALVLTAVASVSLDVLGGEPPGGGGDAHHPRDGGERVLGWRPGTGPEPRAAGAPSPPPTIRDHALLDPPFAAQLGVPETTPDEVRGVGEVPRMLGIDGWSDDSAGSPPPADEAHEPEAETEQESAQELDPDHQPSDQPAVAVVNATVSFYYCEHGGRWHAGDGGGFCGAMKNGEIVHPGAAACARQYLGQRFRIQGDPTGRTYECEDTGNAVHGEHRDIWFHNSDDGWLWLLRTGDRVRIEVLP